MDERDIALNSVLEELKNKKQITFGRMIQE